MNLVVVRPDGTIYARPDTTLVRGARDFYLPDDLSWVEVRPCHWIRIMKSAKAVQARFAQRYYDAVGSGLLLYGNGTDPLLDGSTYIFDASAPIGSEHPAVGTVVGESSASPDGSSPFSACLRAAGIPVPDASTLMPDLIRHLHAALSAVTAHLLLHQGDLLILESPDSVTLHRGDSHPTVSFRIL